MATINFTTKSSPKYLASRTVCIPKDLLDNAVGKDTFNIAIANGFNSNINFTVLGSVLKKNAVLKTSKKNGSEFYVYNY